MADILEEIMATRDAFSLNHHLSSSSDGPTPPSSPMCPSMSHHPKPPPVPCSSVSASASLQPSAHNLSVPNPVLQNMTFLPTSPAAAFTPSPRAVQDAPSPFHFRFSINDTDQPSSPHPWHYSRSTGAGVGTGLGAGANVGLNPGLAVDVGIDTGDVSPLSPPPPPPPPLPSSSSSQLPPSHSQPFFSTKQTNPMNIVESVPLTLDASVNPCTSSLSQPDESTVHFIPQDSFIDSSAATAAAAAAAIGTDTTSGAFSTVEITSIPTSFSQPSQCWPQVMSPRRQSPNSITFSAKRHKTIPAPKPEVFCEPLTTTTTTATTATTTTASTMTTTTAAASVAAASVMQPSAKSILERRAKAMAEGRREDAKLTEVERRIVRRLRNRESAERCRLRRIEHARVLEQRIHCMREENERLVAQAEKYRATIEHYQRVIANYSHRAAVYSTPPPVSSSCPAAQSHSQTVIPDAPTATVGGGRQ